MNVSFSSSRSECCISTVATAVEIEYGGRKERRKERREKKRGVIMTQLILTSFMTTMDFSGQWLTVVLHACDTCAYLGSTVASVFIPSAEGCDVSKILPSRI